MEKITFQSLSASLFGVFHVIVSWPCTLSVSTIAEWRERVPPSQICPFLKLSGSVWRAGIWPQPQPPIAPRGAACRRCSGAMGRTRSADLCLRRRVCLLGERERGGAPADHDPRRRRDRRIRSRCSRGVKRKASTAGAILRRGSVSFRASSRPAASRSCSESTSAATDTCAGN
jgi:hypothetical protein